MNSRIPYYGNGAYCFANSTAMLLASIGENVTPARIEVLSGVGLGAHLLGKNNLLSFGWNVPDLGIDKALRILGFENSRKDFSKTKEPPMENLTKDLGESPLVIGPLDMGLLNYDPSNYGEDGNDHFVLAYKIDEDNIYWHDPAGFPHVFLPLERFKKAWRARRVGYGTKNYSYWAVPKRVNLPSEEEIYKKAIRFFKFLYNHADKKAKEEGWVVGKEAILSLAERVKNRASSNAQIGTLIYFALPLGSRRALDFAAFFDSKDSDLAQLKRQQAKVFGKCQTFAVTRNWLNFISALQQLADIEDQFKTALLKK